MEQTDVNTQGTQNAEERTFTQAELNAIVQKRLGEQASKYENYEELKEKALKYDQIEEESKTELQKATERADALQKELEGMKKADSVRKVREKVSTELGVPANLLTGETEEACKAQADQILNFANAQPGYPAVRDGGETTGTVKKATRDQFAEWMNNGGN